MLAKRKNCKHEWNTRHIQAGSTEDIGDFRKKYDIDSKEVTPDTG